jgi:AcrR family transcriptional regulator
MENWERARNIDQKEFREKEILEAARGLILEKPYEEIKISDFADRISFSRANIYKYFGTKEEIFLLLLSAEVDRFADLLESRFAQLDSGRLGAKRLKEIFPKFWTELIWEEKILIFLFSLTGSILEKNASPEIFLRSKKQIASVASTRIIPVLEEFFPEMPTELLLDFLRYLMILANGLFSFCGPSEIQKSLLRENGLDWMVLDFQRDYAEMIRRSRYLSE